MTDSTSQEARASALYDLVQRRRPTAEAVEALSRFPWDSSDELAMLQRTDVVELLNAFVAGDVQAADVEAWAEGLAGRDDVGFEEPDSELLRRALYELSTPELFGPLDLLAPQWLERLKNSAAEPS